MGDTARFVSRGVVKSWGTVDKETNIVYDVFVSHCKKLAESEDRAVWVADVVEVRGLRPFFDRSDLLEITASALEQAVLASRLLVTVLDPFHVQFSLGTHGKLVRRKLRYSHHHDLRRRQVPLGTVGKVGGPLSVGLSETSGRCDEGASQRFGRTVAEGCEGCS